MPHKKNKNKIESNLFYYDDEASADEKFSESYNDEANCIHNVKEEIN